MLEGVLVLVWVAGTFAVVGAMVGRSHKGLRQECDAWGQSAAHLALTLEPYASRHAVGSRRKAPTFRQRMRGVRGGLEVTCTTHSETTGSGDKKVVRHYTDVSVTLPRPLGLGLKLVRNSGMRGRWSPTAAPTDIELSDPHIDAWSEIHGHDPDEVVSVLGTAPVKEGLMALSRGPFRLWLDDYVLRLQATIRVVSTTDLAPTVEAGLELARRISAARDALGVVSYDARIGEVMAEVGRRLSLDSNDEHSGVAGRVDRMHVEARVVRTAVRRETHFIARFDKPLGVFLSLSRQTAGTGIGKLLLQERDYETGDPSFDARFVVKGSPRESVLAVLVPEVRRRLSELQDTCEQLWVEDDRIVATLGYPVLDPAQLERGLRAMAGAANALAPVAPNDVGPFRS